MGKQHPYLFSQGQAIHNRTLFPCQDTPAVKATYRATVRVPAPFQVVMSANRRTAVGAAGGRTTFELAQDMAVPSYLVALAAGNLASRAIGPRSAVWCEPEVLEAAAWEFAQTEQFVAAAEGLGGPYRWGRYDLLLLPPSFPFGGMENPCMTFLTPSLLAGDRSLVDVVAHEIAHSWTGNLVTNANWENFWLNEGYTMFLERKIIQRMEGEPARHLSALVGLAELEHALAEFPDGAEGRRLCPDLRSTSPDDIFSVVPYEKGHTLLFHLEELVGGPAAFEPCLRAYIEHFAGTPVHRASWQRFIVGYFAGCPAAAARLATVDWEAWYTGTGMPPVIPRYDRSQLEAVEAFAAAWFREGRRKGAPDAFAESFTLNQRLMFFDVLDKLGPVAHPTLAELDAQYGLMASGNVEILLRWLRLCLENAYAPAFLPAAKFATQHGRGKYCRPIYKLLFRHAASRALAVETFTVHRMFYHPWVRGLIAKELQLAE